jgi:hypothetical protein
VSRFLRATRCFAAVRAVILCAACSSGRISVGDDSDAALDSGAGGPPIVDAANGALDARPATAGDLTGITASCPTRVSASPLASAPGRTPDVNICRVGNAIFWKSGLAVLCAGKSSTTCNAQIDPQYQATTTAKDSLGQDLDAAVLPYVEVAARTASFDYLASGLEMGTVVAVVYKDQLQYGVLGTVGQANIIGDASYAMATLLGINPDPVVGGVSSGVVYLAFTGPNTVLSKNEDRAEAVALGQAAAAALIAADK